MPNLHNLSRSATWPRVEIRMIVAKADVEARRLKLVEDAQELKR